MTVANQVSASVSQSVGTNGAGGFGADINLPLVDAAYPALNGAGYTYDPGGNLKTGGGYALTYDALGYPTQKTYSATSEDYIYTADDERLAVRRNGWYNWSVSWATKIERLKPMSEKRATRGREVQRGAYDEAFPPERRII